MSLSLQVIGSTSLSPVSAVPLASPRRTSARTKNATAGFDDGLVIVTLVTSAPSLPAVVEPAVVEPVVVDAAACTGSDGRPCSAVMSAYWVSGAPLSACGLPSVLFQSITSGWVESQ